MKLWPCGRCGEPRLSSGEEFREINELLTEGHHHGELSGEIKTQYKRDQGYIILMMLLFRNLGIREWRKQIVRISPYLWAKFKLKEEVLNLSWVKA